MSYSNTVTGQSDPLPFTIDYSHAHAYKNISAHLLMNCVGTTKQLVVELPDLHPRSHLSIEPCHTDRTGTVARSRWACWTESFGGSAGLLGHEGYSQP